MMLAAGCAGVRTDWVPLSPPPHNVAPRPDEDVEIFTAGAPRRPYVEVGILEIQADRYDGTGPTEVLHMLRDEAAMRGCDGVVIIGQDSTTSRYRIGYRGTCIVYKLSDDGG